MESVFEIIAEPNRRAILSLLVSSQQSVGEIERQLHMPQTTVSKHLRVLREAGFVERTVSAQQRLYRLRPESLKEVDAWLAPFRRLWSDHVDALERHLDRIDPIHTNKKEDEEKEMTDTEELKVDSPSKLIDAKIEELRDWRGEMLALVRALIRQADPEVVEEWKWRGTPVWSHAGIICTGETYKNVVKMTFAKGASLEDPSCLFNSSLDGNTRRAIDFHEGDTIDEAALKALIRAAVTLNLGRLEVKA